METKANAMAQQHRWADLYASSGLDPLLRQAVVDKVKAKQFTVEERQSVREHWGVGLMMVPWRSCYCRRCGRQGLA